MAILILIIFIGLMVILAKKGKKSKNRKAFNQLSADDKDKVAAVHHKTQQETDELITVILPTINDGK